MAVRCLTGALCAMVVLCSPAAAARPAAGGHYYGFESDEARPFSVLGVDAELRVARSRDRLARGSYLEWQVACPGRDAGGKFRLRGTKLSRRGGFSGGGEIAGRRYRIRGRFISRGYARARYSLSGCRRPAFPVALYLDGEPPFAGCRRQRAQTLASSADGRVFERYRLESNGEFFPHVYGCLFGPASGQVLLGRNYDEETIEHPVVLGRYAAYASVGCGLGACNSAIVLQPLDLPGAPEVRLPSVLGGGYLSSAVESLVLKQNGSLAWLVVRSGPTSEQVPPLVREVYAVDAQGSRRLDSGPALAEKSLRLDPATSTLSWLNAGAQRTAPLD
jgi:hypothetical protein